MKRGKRAIGFVLALAALLVGVLCWRVDRLYLQEQQNYALIAAIKAQKRTLVLELLSSGADANARDTGPAPSFLQMLRRLFASVGKHAAPADAAHPCVLSLAGRAVKNYVPNRRLPRLSHPDEAIQLALLDHSANPNVEDRDEYGDLFSSLGYALWHRQDRVVRRLLERGADPNTRALEDPQGSYRLMPLHVATRDVHSSEVLHLLVEHGAEVNAADSEGITPLMNVARTGRTGDMIFLLQHGARIEAKSDDGRTALICAVEWDQLDAVRLLLKQGAGINAKDHDGETALEVAKQEASVKAKDDDGDTADKVLNAHKIIALLKQYGATK